MQVHIYVHACKFVFVCSHVFIYRYMYIYIEHMNIYAYMRASV